MSYAVQTHLGMPESPFSGRDSGIHMRLPVTHYNHLFDLGLATQDSLSLGDSSPYASLLLSSV